MQLRQINSELPHKDEGAFIVVFIEVEKFVLEKSFRAGFANNKIY